VNILLGLTGSVATTLAPKLLRQLNRLGEVKVVTTKSSLYFFDLMALSYDSYTDIDEWPGPIYVKNDDVLHIQLRDWADVLVIAPLSANTLAKIANGLCDNLLTSVFRAWRRTHPIVLAPAMNTVMWESPFSKQHLDVITKMYDCQVVPPQSKMLACGEAGEGAMAQIDDLYTATRDSYKWQFPIECCFGIPVGVHPGSFGYARNSGGPHTGVDLYCREMQSVFAVEAGKVVGIEHFTGEQDGTPWWNNTDCVLIEGKSGVCCYGEIKPYYVQVGDFVNKGGLIGHAIPVLKDGKHRSDIPGHSRTMLHFELYKHGVRNASQSFQQGVDELGMVDPTTFLQNARNAPVNLTM
jgi:phosphopantothenoylcysteine decarboxylase